MYYKTPEEAEAAMRKEESQCGIYHGGLIGGNDCPPDYMGDGRTYDGHRDYFPVSVYGFEIWYS